MPESDDGVAPNLIRQDPSWSLIKGTRPASHIATYRAAVKLNLGLSWPRVQL